MVARVAEALAAYANTAARGSAAGLEAREALPGNSFAEMVRDMVGETVEAQRTAEQLTTEALVGRADINEVVLAVGNAEVGLQTVIGIRDKMIEAYKDIMRMPI
ncbi:MAG: flagellar hook-basal body complex protein FliE [Alphaproteobacteria bacterium]|jgi:flagellar hook-basal body complex protein FliE|nr:flagellar hook-basal body complex protein FliE [Alphaproteobacteria bacterium]